MMNNEEFGKEMRDIIEKKIIKEVTQRDWVDDSYGSNKIKFDEDMLYQVYSGIDNDRLVKLIQQRVEEEMINKVVNRMATEISTDIKQLMSNKNVREELRFVVRTKIKEVEKKIFEEDDK